jgi:uncharacterized damage-inducible protein DinB
MDAMKPEQGTFLLQFEMPILQREHATTKQVIEAIPANKGDYRPDANSKTAMEIAWHVAAAEERFLGGIAAGGFNFEPIHQPENVKTPADIAKWYEESFAKNSERIGKLKGEDLVKMLDFRGAFQMPAVAFLDFTMRHMIHHRGQMATYLRPMGGKVPAMYGESFDSAEAKKASSAGQA